ncbi:hypothetical protein AC792_05890 [Arthrobacter sp. RIT-PI-e]|uniref:hypothetical protein n=1 Tax=Arthrobacter sp. RIT-PI-e TaxID=1681197 RepID=UPI0006765169|nr:hypothetical protein [Arthrobacter sp. RIT-PI-e]KNC19504.1 hypothetical protein AC792_05890 [Arthrobacter sp. RIT-PI-e]
MAFEIDPQDLTPEHIEVINEGRKLEGIDLTLFGYFGGPELQGACIGRMQLDEEGRLPASNYDSPEERLRDLVLVQSLRGALRRSIPIVLAGIFEDIFAIRTLEATGGDIGSHIASASAQVVDMLPAAYRDHYTSAFVQRFAVVLAEVAADFEMGWDVARTFAHELAVYCFARKGVRHVDAECGTRLGAVGIDRIMTGFLEDASVLQEVYHQGSDDTGGPPSWFDPYDAASRVNPYLHPQGQPTTEQLDLLEHQLTREVPERYPGTARQGALRSGELIDISPYASRHYFLCPVAVEQTVLTALGFNDLPQDAQWQDVLLHILWHGAAEHPAWKSYNYIAPGFDGEKAYIVAVAGTDEMDAPVLTIQYLGEVVDDDEDDDAEDS